MRPLLAFGLLGTATALMAPPRITLRRPYQIQPAQMTPELQTALTLNTGLATIGTLAGQKQLTKTGLVHAWALGVILWSSFVGWRGYSLCVLYLVVGSAATKIKQKQKEAQGIAEGRGGARGPENVWGSAATAAMCALYGFRKPSLRPLLAVAYVSSLATKLSDTLASEVGKAYGKTCYLSTTLKRVPPGTEGAVSLEGTLAGFAGSVLAASYAVAVGLTPRAALLPVVVAAFVATTCESWLGAGAQGKVRWLTNEVINFLNTLIGAGVGAALSFRLFNLY